MAFTADLNPKNKSMDLGDLLKMDEAMTKRKLYQDALNPKASAKTTATPNADSILAKPAINDMIKSSADDAGVQFKFGNNNQ